MKEDYKFLWANDGKVGQEVTLSEIFGDKPTLLIYNFMYGPGWDNPCLSCASLVDGFDRTAFEVSHDAAFWGTELQGNHVDTVWPYWNLMDFTPEGRPDRMMPPQNFRSEFLEKHLLNI